MAKQGRFWRIEKGIIQNDADISNIKPPYDALVKDAVAAYTRNIPNDIHSIYVTGSVPRGLAVEGDSDLNTFAILESQLDPELVMQDWIPDEEDDLLDKYDCVSDIQLELWPYGYVFRDPAEFSMGAFIIKTHSVCVWGSNVTPQLPDYTGPEAFIAIANDDVIQIQPGIESAIDDIEAEPDADNVYEWSQVIGKNFLRAGFALLMPTLQQYTHDIDVCYSTFAQHYPQQAKSMQKALKFVQDPTESPRTLLKYLNTFGSWMIEEADRWLNQYNPDRHVEYQFEPMDDD